MRDIDALAAIDAIEHPCHDVCVGDLHADCQCAAYVRQEARRIAQEAALRAGGSHCPHLGNHDGYACGLSGPHCWACNEPWPCRTARG